ncbi:Rossmann-like and DUF2520 domain-containing protein [Dysgonomonas sp. 520]|uniref:Rossmann-like and DUF2520 domain-containing protein n=1 Tax=Dysgonomonas sp. 520 TaxID=2302931 RepID=UPI0013D542B6|nr:Rossmann-like and DUF2520 domain-containing protein [Dysgonomonas sp. 520]NDW09243.1 DUF2520 domain-containing protein [Dysgonomonas sp. 520]
MRVVLIGAGNLATQLALALSDKSVEIVQVYSRTVESAKTLADMINCPYTTSLDAVVADADFYIFSVKDSVLEELIGMMPATNGIWLHTAGSMPMGIFEGFTKNYGVLYPFQTFSKSKKVDFSVIPIFIEANSSENIAKIEGFCRIISDFVHILSSEKRQYLHLTGVFACNFVNHLYHISEAILAKEDIPFASILPLIEETANKVKDLSPSEAQTGPALRMDKNVIDKHLDLIKDPSWKEIYSLMSEDIYRMNKKN